jgi:beta-glucosidase
MTPSLDEGSLTESAGRGVEKGAVLTATELEGCAPAADWSRWIRQGKAPESGRGASFADSWAEDLDQLAGLGINSIQLTLEWARLEPKPGHYDEAAVELRSDLLRAARGLGLTTWGCLVDGTLPGWFQDDEGGFSNDKARTLLWPRHIDWVGEQFGDLVDGWVPQREPITWALRRYLRAEAPPGRSDPKAAAEAVRAAVLADGEAWRLLRGSAPVAAYHTARAVFAERDNVKAAPLARGLDGLLWRPWLGALTEGILVAGDLPALQVDHLRGAFDRVVVELRPAVQIDGAGRWNPYPPDRAAGPSGWVAWPEVMAECLHRVAGELDGIDVVAAGSLADVTDDGRSRPDHLKAMLDHTAEASSEATVVGWWQSSPIDGYHWQRGFAIRPGLIDRERAESPAAATFRAYPEPG